MAKKKHLDTPPLFLGDSIAGDVNVYIYIGRTCMYISSLVIQVWDLSMQSTWTSIACKGTMTGHLETVRCLQVRSRVARYTCT